MQKPLEIDKIIHDDPTGYEPSTELTSNRHSICLPCAREIYPEIVTQAHKWNLNETIHTIEFCCYCGWLHASGIYLETEELNSDMLCHGNHRAAPQDEDSSYVASSHPSISKQVIEVIAGLAVLTIGAITAILWMASTK